METLVTKLQSKGLTRDQIQNLFVAIHAWLEEHYPIIAKISKPVMAEELGIEELSHSEYIIIDNKEPVITQS